MPLTKKVNFNKVSNDLFKSSLETLRKEAPNVETGIITRTQKGKDVNLKSFKPYSKSYKTAKQKKGRTGKVDLTFTGNMLNSITHKNIKDGVRFTFSAKAERDKASWNNKIRYFFGIDKHQIKAIQKQLSKLH